MCQTCMPIMQAAQCSKGYIITSSQSQKLQRGIIEKPDLFFCLAGDILACEEHGATERC